MSPRYVGLGPLAIITPVGNNMTGTAVVLSTVLDFTSCQSGGIRAGWTGTPTGTFVVQGSFDYGINGASAQWDDMGIGATNPAGSAGSTIIDLARTGVPYYRLKYTNSGGTGALTAYACGKAGA